MAGKTRGLQHHGLPQRFQTSSDPFTLDPSKPVTYRRAQRPNGVKGAVPAEAFQYDVVYKAFCEDTLFWKTWNVVGSSQTPPGVSIARDKAAIRVVLDLSPYQSLYPSVYTPGERTVPRCCEPGSDEEPEAEIPGLPIGYSIALDVYLVESARSWLRIQREFRGGRIDKDSEWLDSIVRRYDEQQGKPSARAKARVSKPGDVARAPLSQGLESYSALYGNAAERADEHAAGLTTNEQLAAEALVGAAERRGALGGDLGPAGLESLSLSMARGRPSPAKPDGARGAWLDRELERVAPLPPQTAEGSRGSSQRGSPAHSSPRTPRTPRAQDPPKSSSTITVRL